MTDTVCKQSDDGISTVKLISNLTVGRVRKLKDKAAAATQQRINVVVGKAKQKKQGFMAWTTNKTGKFFNYFKAPPSKRPDLLFLRNILLLIVAFFIVYYILPKVSGAVGKDFSKAQFNKAVKLPETAFNIEEIAKVNQEVKAFEDHKAFFDDGGAFAPSNAGVHEVGKTSVALPMLIFFLQFILPPIAIGYIIWFIITYWPYVYAAMWGWFITMYNYFTTLIQGKLGCKWYIRWVTGWRCSSPNFGQYLREWRRVYIDRPVATEKVKYIKKYIAAKDRYVTKPMEKYITKPIKYYGVKNEYAQKIASDRTVEVLLKKARDSQISGPLGPSSIIGRLYGSIIGNIAAKSKSAKISKDQLVDGYDSQTVTGETCQCPGASDTVKSLAGRGANLLSNIKRDMPEFNTGSNSKGRRACELADQTIKDRAAIMGLTIIAIIAALMLIYAITWKFGTPVFVKNIISNVNIRSTMSNIQSKRWPYLPYIIIAMTIGILSHTGFAY